MRFQCPYCRGIVAVDNTDLGQDVQCGHCNEVVTVPHIRVATGAVISDFIVLEELGRGGMGIVYLTHQISLDRPAALKVLAENYASNAEFVVGFIKEARAAAKLNHPHIVQAYAVGEDEGVFFFAMECIDGETMKDVLKREKIIPVKQAISIIQQIAEALDYAWKEQRLIHRDIKPDNIMLTKNGRAKLADLGLARVAGDIDDAEGDEVMGTPQYISPEHLTGAPMDIRSDIYSLGATFYHFLTGRFPFEGKTATEIARKHLEERLVPPHILNPKIPEGVSQIVQKMMAKSVNNRYQDAEMLVDDLRLARRGRNPSFAGGGTKTNAKGKKTLRINTGGRTGRFKPQKMEATGIYTKTTSTGTLRQADSNHTIDSSQLTKDLSELKKHKAEASKKKAFMLLGLLIISIAGVAVFLMTKKKKGKVTVPPKVVVPTNPTDSTPVIKETRYSKAGNALLAYIKNNPDNTDTILEKFEQFYEKLTPSDAQVDKDVSEKLQVLFTKYDEPRLEKARQAKREKHLAFLKKLEEKLKKLKEKEEAARRERERIAALKAKKAREEAARRAALLAKKRAFQEKIQNYKNSLAAKRKELEGETISYTRKRQYKAAISLFDDALKEPQRVKTQSVEEIKLATEHYNWCFEFIEKIKIAEKVWKAFYNSGKKLAGTQVEALGELGKVISIKKELIAFKTMGGGKLVVPFSKLSKRQQIKLLKFAAKKVKEKNPAFYYFLFMADFKLAQREIETDQEKKILSTVAEQYFKYVLKKGPRSERIRIKKRYSRWTEYKNAIK